MKDYAKGRVRPATNAMLVAGVTCLVKDTCGWSYPGYGNTAEVIREACAEAIRDTQRARDRRAARIAFRFVEALSDQEQVEFHAKELRDEILSAKPRKGKA